MGDHVDDASPRTRKRGLRKKVMLGAALAGMASVAGLAFGEWLATGAGEGYARSGIAEALTTEFAEASDTLYPGGTGDLVLRIHNPNPFPVTVTTVGGNGPITSSDSACNAAGHGVTFTGVANLNLVVGAETSQTFTLVGALSMSLDSANECQGDTFSVPVSLNGGSSGGGGGDPEDCDDGDPLTIDVFEPVSQSCTHTVCNDNNPLTTDAVDGGNCVHIPVPNGTACDTGDPNVPGEVVDGVCVAVSTWYPDADGDGYGDPAGAQQTANPPAGYVTNGGDCDDDAFWNYPGNVEVPDMSDNNCNGIIDEGIDTWYLDADQDGFGGSTTVLGAPQTGYVATGGDCDDSNENVNPAAVEILANGIDEDCDGVDG
jgi:Putative metal-binding motif